MSETHRRTVDTRPEDVEYVNQFLEEVRTLVGAVVEIMDKNQVLLLSPVFRDMLVEQARKVESLQSPLSHKLVADNPGEPLKPRQA